MGAMSLTPRATTGDRQPLHVCAQRTQALAASEFASSPVAEQLLPKLTCAPLNALKKGLALMVVMQAWSR